MPRLAKRSLAALIALLSPIAFAEAQDAQASALFERALTLPGADIFYAEKDQVAAEEMAKAIDMGDYYRIPCDTRDLNYDKYFTEGSECLSKIEDYHSHNTTRLDVEGMKKLLLRLRFIQEDLGLIERAKPREIRSE